MIARRKIPRAIRAPTMAPTTATIPLRRHPCNPIGGAGKNGSNHEHHRKNTPTIIPMTIKTAPTALLFPDPKYAVKIPAMTLATANTSISMDKK